MGWKLSHNYDLGIPSGQDGKIASELSAGLSRGWERSLNPHRLLAFDVRDVERCLAVTVKLNGRRPLSVFSEMKPLSWEQLRVQMRADQMLVASKS